MSQKRVLVVDDEPDIREVARMSLEMVAGWEVLTAASGREALACAAAERPDAILLDVMMPDLDGPATFRRLRSDPATRDIPVILLTAKVQAAEQRQFAELGVNAILTKPFDPMQLAKKMAEILAWPLE
jgi:CheY-like chemotaxis protein